MRHAFLMLASTCVCAAAIRPLHAQASSDTTASFRAGQWGMGFILRNNFTAAGVLRFSTPTRAWVLDGSASFDQQSQSQSTVFGEQTLRNWNLSADFGPRWYHAMSAHATGYAGFGMLAGYGGTNDSESSNHASIWSVGAYGEAGMQYMLTRYLGLGWRGTLSASRNDATSTNMTPQGFIATAKATGYHVALDAVQLTGTIYF